MKNRTLHHVRFVVTGMNFFAGYAGGGVFLLTGNSLMNSNARTIAVSGTDLYAETHGEGRFRRCTTT
jgi:hypothetical protein